MSRLPGEIFKEKLFFLELLPFANLAIENLLPEKSSTMQVLADAPSGTYLFVMCKA